jgi:AcrR family transcriptional regulator
MHSSLQDVALKAKMSKAGIYHYFKSKEELLAYIIFENTKVFLRLLNDCMEENRKKKLSPKEAFKRLIHLYASYLNHNKDIRLIILRERHQLSRDLKKELLEKENEIFLLLRSELQKIPNLEKGLDLSVITFLIISMCHWLGYWFKEGQELDIDKIIDQNTWIIYNGVLKDRETRYL